MGITLAGVRICRIHDEDDVVPGRICGLPMPCRDHGPAAGPRDPRWIKPRDRRIRKRPGIELTISREAMRVLDRLAESAGSRSAAVERWLLAQAAETTVIARARPTVDTAELLETAEWAGDLDAVHEQRIRAAAAELYELRRENDQLNVACVDHAKAHAETKRELEQLRARLTSAEKALEFYAEWGHSLDDKPGLRARNHFARYGGSNG